MKTRPPLIGAAMRKAFRRLRFRLAAWIVTGRQDDQAMVVVRKGGRLTATGMEHCLIADSGHSNCIQIQPQPGDHFSLQLNTGRFVQFEPGLRLGSEWWNASRTRDLESRLADALANLAVIAAPDFAGEDDAAKALERAQNLAASAAHRDAQVWLPSPSYGAGNFVQHPSGRAVTATGQDAAQDDGELS